MTAPVDPADARSPAPQVVRVAAAALIVEALGLAVLGAVDLAKVITGSPRSAPFAVLAAVLALLTGAALVLLARALVRRRRRAYAPVIVLQALALPVGYSLAVQAGLWYYGGPVLLLAISVLGLLFSRTARQAVGPG